MLVLSRKKNESLIIGDNIVLTVVSISNGKVRLGIEAPNDVKIFREEVALKMASLKDADKPKEEITLESSSAT